MAGVSVDGGKGRKRALDSEINMIPMIDLLLVTVSFLLITAVWSQAQRLESSAQVPGSEVSPPCADDCKEEPRLHVETADPAKFTLAWKQGRTVVHSTVIPRETNVRAEHGVAFSSLAAGVASEWRSNGTHRDASDKRFDRAVVHANDEMRYSELVAIMDAVAQPKRSYAAGGKLRNANAFEITFAAD